MSIATDSAYDIHAVVVSVATPEPLNTVSIATSEVVLFAGSIVGGRVVLTIDFIASIVTVVDEITHVCLVDAPMIVALELVRRTAG